MKRGRRAWLAAAVLVMPVAVLVLAPERRLVCSEPYIEERSPDGRWSLTVCRRPMLLAMPGSSSDAPGWIVLRDRHGSIRAVSDLSMLQLYGGAAPGTQTEWSEARVFRPMVLDLPVTEASGPLRRWFDDRLWRLRAILGFTPSEEGLS